MQLPNKYKPFVIAAKAAMSIALLYLIYNTIDIDTFFRILADVEPVYVLLAVLVTWINVFISAYRWQQIQTYFRLASSFGYCLRIYAEALTLNLVLPGSVGGDFYRAYKLAIRSGMHWNAISSVLADRFVGFFVLVCLCVVIVLLQGRTLPGNLGAVVVVLAAATVLGFLVTYLVPASRAAMRFGPYRYFIRLLYIVRRLFRGVPRTLSVLAMSLMAQGAIVASMAFSIAAVSGDVSRLDLAVFATTFAALAAMIPITLAGFGLREGAIVGTLVFFGVSSTQSAAIAVVFTVSVIAQCLPGAISWVLPHDSRLAGKTRSSANGTGARRHSG